MKQLQRTRVMHGFKKGKITLLVATDVAARGIDVSDVDYVFNFDIPKVPDYYVHRIGRTGRAGRAGTAITLCSGRQQIFQLQQLGRHAKSVIKQIQLPTVDDIEVSNRARDLETVEKALQSEPQPFLAEMVEELKAKGYAPEKISAVLLGLCFQHNTAKLPNLKATVKSTRAGCADIGLKSKTQERRRPAADLVIDAGSANRVAANHIVGAITERAGISSWELGKIQIFEAFSTVSVPAERLNDIVFALQGCKICGKPVHGVERRGRLFLSARVQGFRHRWEGGPVLELHHRRGAQTLRLSHPEPSFPVL